MHQITVTARTWMNRPLIGLFLLLLVGVVVACGSVVYAADSETTSSRHLITIHDRGTVRSVISAKDTLKEVFEEADIPIDEKDRVEPSLDHELTGTDYQVNVYRARPITIVDGQHQTRVMTAYQTPKQIASDAGISLRDEDVAELALPGDIISDGASLRMVIDRAVPIKLDLYGKIDTVYTQAEIVKEFLDEKSIELGKDDRMSRSTDDALESGDTLRIWREGKQTITRDEAIPFETEKIQDANREAGYKKIDTAGTPGEKMVTYEIVMRNGKEVSRKVIQSVVTKKPVKQIETVGAKFNYTGGPLSDAQINALGQCESGMTPTRNSGNGFYGAFQFMPSTWQNVAPSPYNAGMPHEAPLDAQKQAVQNLLSRSSIYTQFPGCARKMQAQGIL